MQTIAEAATICSSLYEEVIRPSADDPSTEHQLVYQAQEFENWVLHSDIYGRCRAPLDYWVHDVEEIKSVFIQLLDAIASVLRRVRSVRRARCRSEASPGHLAIEKEVFELERLLPRLRRLSNSIRSRAVSVRMRQTATWWWRVGILSYGSLTQQFEDEMMADMRERWPKIPVWLSKRLLAMSLTFRTRALYIQHHSPLTTLGANDLRMTRTDSTTVQQTDESCAESRSLPRPTAGQAPDHEGSSRTQRGILTNPNEEGRWKIWNDYLDRELDFFVCVKEDCPSPEKPYCTLEDLLHHMRSGHRSHWVCTSSEHDQMVIYDNEYLFRTHMKTEHKRVFSSVFSLPQLSRLCYMNELADRKTLSPCCFCGAGDASKLESAISDEYIRMGTHITRHFREITKRVYDAASAAVSDFLMREVPVADAHLRQGHMIVSSESSDSSTSLVTRNKPGIENVVSKPVAGLETEKRIAQNTAKCFVSAVSRDEYHVDVFICTLRGRVETIGYKTDESPEPKGSWKPIGGKFGLGAQITVVRSAKVELDLFTCDSGGNVYRTWWHGWSILDDWAHRDVPFFSTNNQWSRIGTAFPRELEVIAAGRSPDITLFLCDEDGWIKTSRALSGGEWPALEKIHHAFGAGTRLAAVTMPVNRQRIIVCDAEGSVWTSWLPILAQQHQKGKPKQQWSDLQLIGEGFIGAEITAVEHELEVDLFMCGQDRQIWTAPWTEDSGRPTLTSWKILQARFLAVGKVVAVVRDRGNYDLFVRDTYSRFWTTGWKRNSNQPLNWEEIPGSPPALSEIAVVASSRKAPADMFAWFQHGREWTLRWKRVGLENPPGWTVIWPR